MSAVLYDDLDLPWIGTVVDAIVAAAGAPMRVLRERTEQLEHAGVTVPAAHVTAIVRAHQRLAGGAAERGRIARRVRALVLGSPALTAADHAARLAAASAELGLSPDDVAGLLWIDLADERPVTLPAGRPDPRRLAALANLDVLQRAVHRAHAVRIRVWGEAHELIRRARQCGLLLRVRAADVAGVAVTVLDVLGPLALFHATRVYGRALAALVPLLADQARYELEVRTAPAPGPADLRVIPPVLLPALRAPRRPSLAARLARELTAAAPGLAVTVDPPPLAHDHDRLHPELALEIGGERWYLELVGFATAAHLAALRARYAAAGAPRVLLCVDARRASPDVVTTPGALVLPFDRRPRAAAVLAALRT